jgi:2-polyprenyl-3-methyl-5-hydroxy-6-metoxy-1,4-benzoquinol methylase
VPVQTSSELERLGDLGWCADALGPLVDGVRIIAGHESTDVHYPDRGLHALGLDGAPGYWFAHRAREVVDELERATRARAIWDIGAGTGAMSTRFAQAGHDVVAVEPLVAGARAIARQRCCTVFCATLEELRLPAGSLRVVGMFDVIEHIADLHGLMTEVRRVLEPGGVLAVTVPALPSLWSEDDDVAGHHRRYRRSQLDAQMQSWGFERVTSRYLFASLVVAAAVARALPYRLGRRRGADAVMAATAKQLRPSPWVERIARGVLSAEHALARRATLPVGLSVLGIYRRPLGAATW